MQHDAPFFLLVALFITAASLVFGLLTFHDDRVRRSLARREGSADASPTPLWSLLRPLLGRHLRRWLLTLWTALWIGVTTFLIADLFHHYHPVPFYVGLWMAWLAMIGYGVGLAPTVTVICMQDLLLDGQGP